jgi:hypothetical protein
VLKARGSGGVDLTCVAAALGLLFRHAKLLWLL